MKGQALVSASVGLAFGLIMKEALSNKDLVFSALDICLIQKIACHRIYILI